MTDSVKSTKLVVFSPLPPTENGIADYTFELIAELSTTFSITAVIENHRTPPPQSTHFTSISVNEYISDEELYVNEIHLYQLGNNIDHAYIVPILLRRPGIVVLHDVSLHHLVDQMTLRWGDRQLYKGFLSQEYGYRGRLIADQFDQRNWRGRPIFYTLPLTRTLLSAATTVIVHSAYALTKVVAQVPDVPAQLVRHHVSRKAVDHAIAVPKHTDRLAIGVNDDRLLLVSLGFLTKAKQIGEVLNVLAACRGHLPPFHYYLVGQENKEDYNIQEQIRKYGLSGEVTITGYVDEQTFFNYANASDIIINLRYPTGGETSGTLIRALALGACVIVNDIGPFSEYPDDVCVKIPVGSEQSNSLKRELLSLGLSARRRKAYGKSASEFMKRTHSMANSARLYTRTINRARIRRATEPVLEHSFLSVYEHELRMRRMCANGYLPPLWAQLNSMPVGRRDSKLVALVGGSGGEKTVLQDVFSIEPLSILEVGHDEPSTNTKNNSCSSCLVVFLPDDFQHQINSLDVAANFLLTGGRLVVCVRIGAAQCIDTPEAWEFRLGRLGLQLLSYQTSRSEASFSLDQYFSDQHPCLVITARKYSNFCALHECKPTGALNIT